MNPIDLLKTIYLGDRGCKGILIDGWNSSVALHATVISRIRSTTGRWEYYTAEDIVDGRIVFTGVRSFGMSPAGPIPNDFINEITATAFSADGRDANSGETPYRFKISISSVDMAGAWTEITIEITADGLHLEDPGNPGAVIRT
jgi:hypothetical protein